MVKDPKKVVQEIVQLVGKPKAERLLIAEKASPSSAGKLVRGKYESAIGELLAEAIDRARIAAEKLADAG